MNKLNFLFCLLVFSLTVGITSCSKVEGCTDQESPSFNVEAEKDDGSCQSVADAMAGTWNARETALGIPLLYEVTITKVDDNTITIEEKDRVGSPGYAPASYEVDLGWTAKSVSSANDVYTGSIKDDNTIEVSYDVTSSTSPTFTVDLVYTR